MGRVLGGLLTMLFAACAAVVWFWTLQNTDQVARMRLDLGRMVGAWEMRDAMPVTTLMGVSFAAGAFLAGVFFLAWGMGLKRRIEELERAAAFSPSRY
ncbi:MAG TPA: LapA family protein [Myxococcota bacterium]|nr:LapA family protein [Myxococcota bacterium]